MLSVYAFCLIQSKAHDLTHRYNRSTSYGQLLGGTVCVEGVVDLVSPTVPLC